MRVPVNLRVGRGFSFSAPRGDWLLAEIEDFLDVPLAGTIENEGFTSAGNRPDYGSGSYLWLMAAAIDLARRDMSNPSFSEECRSFLEGDLVALFSECIGYEGTYLNA